MARRHDLQEALEDLMAEEHKGNVYFQPPPAVTLKYPAIVYSRDAARTAFASNAPYLYEKRYQVMVISKKADDTLPDKIARFPKCLFSRQYVANNLYHDVFNLYF